MNIIPKKDLSLLPIHTSGDTLPQVDNFSSDLKWRTHVDSVIHKASKRIYILRIFVARVVILLSFLMYTLL